jgi:hypothetical protein
MITSYIYSPKLPWKSRNSTNSREIKTNVQIPGIQERAKSKCFAAAVTVRVRVRAKCHSTPHNVRVRAKYHSTSHNVRVRAIIFTEERRPRFELLTSIPVAWIP